MRDPRCWRELFVRAGTMLIVAAVLYFFLGMDARIWLLPVAVAALVCVKWTFRPKAQDELDPPPEGSSD